MYSIVNILGNVILYIVFISNSYNLRTKRKINKKKIKNFKLILHQLINTVKIQFNNIT